MTDPLLSSLAILPIVTAIFLLFFCLFVCQLYRQLRAEQARMEEKAVPVSEAGGGKGYRCARSVRSLKRRSELRRTRSVDTVYRRRDSQLVRVRSDPHLSIPRASLTVIEKRYSTTNLNTSTPSQRRPASMTRDQIIQMFSSPESLSQGF